MNNPNLTCNRIYRQDVNTKIGYCAYGVPCLDYHRNANAKGLVVYLKDLPEPTETHGFSVWQHYQYEGQPLVGPYCYSTGYDYWGRLYIEHPFMYVNGIGDEGYTLDYWYGRDYRLNYEPDSFRRWSTDSRADINCQAVYAKPSAKVKHLRPIRKPLAIARIVTQDTKGRALFRKVHFIHMRLAWFNANNTAVIVRFASGDKSVRFKLGGKL